MDSIEIKIEGEVYELSPSFGFIKRLKKTLNTGSLLQIQIAVAQLDPTVVADVLEAALKSKGVNKYSSDAIGDLIMKKGIECHIDGEDVGAVGAAVKMLTMTLESFTSEKKTGESEKN